MRLFVLVILLLCWTCSGYDVLKDADQRVGLALQPASLVESDERDVFYSVLLAQQLDVAIPFIVVAANVLHS